MRTNRFWNGLLLVAIIGIGSWGCQRTTDDGQGGSAGGEAGKGGGGGSAGEGGSGEGGSGGKKTFTSTLPCDVYAEDGGPCVAAHSTVRALFADYDGPLYQVRRADGETKDIGVIEKGGFAKSSDQDEFCTEKCTISIIYDQSSQGNHLTKAPPGEMKKTEGKEATATALPLTLDGHKVYGEKNVVGVGYRNNQAKGTAENDDPETIYMVASGDYYNAGCCFDYGNAERNSKNNGEGTMEAVYFGNCTIWNKGDGDGPWVMGDLEDGLWAGNTSPYTESKPITYKLVTGMVKGGKAGANRWAIKAGNAQDGALNTVFIGPRPSDRYNPMRKEGAIILGTGGDNSNGGVGNFFEGVMTAHFSSDEADEAVHANIVSVYKSAEFIQE